MKRLLSLVLALTLVISIVTGCTSDPVAEELENFLNVQMVDVNNKYEEIKAEAALWGEFENDEQLKISLNDILLPKCEEALKMLNEIELTTPEVTEIKGKFVKVIELYKKGFELILGAIDSGDEAALTEGQKNIEDGVATLDEYNKALKELASEKGLEIE